MNALPHPHLGWIEQDRLAALDRYGILDTPTERDFDEIVRLAAETFEAPIAVVNLIADGRQWFKAEVGIGARELPLDVSICAHAILQSDTMIVPDTRLDERFICNPLVTAADGLRFYAGALLKTEEGLPLGTVCVLDREPRPEGITEHQRYTLEVLARVVMTQMEMRRIIAQQAAYATRLEAEVRERARSEVRRNALLSIGDSIRSVNSVSDITRTASRIVAQTLGAIRAGFARVDPGGELVTIEADWSADGYASLAGDHRLADYGDLKLSEDAIVVSDVQADETFGLKRDALLSIGVRAMANIPVRDHQGRISLFFAHGAEPREWSPEDLTFLRNAGDRVAASVARIDAEALQQVLNMELSHRMKNTMAMVQAIAKQTLRSVPDQAPVEAFRSRLQALSTAHMSLLQQDWSAAKMHDVVTNVLGTLDRVDRFQIDGPNLKLGARATLSMSLLLHELATNAIKYGALSQPSGTVSVAWLTETDQLILDWRETGGPPAVAPAKGGFGSRLINMGLIGTGGVDLHYLPTGFRARFTAPLSQVSDR